jgi:hypothetical protein
VASGGRVLLAAFDREAGCVATKAAELVGEPGDESLLLVQGQTRDSYRLLWKELSHEEGPQRGTGRAQKGTNGVSDCSGGKE